MKIYNKIRHWLPAVVWLCLMFIVSSLQVTYENVRLSLLGRALTAIKRYLYRHSNAVADFTVRNIDKIYHTFEYFVFTVLLYYAVSKTFKISTVRRFIIVFASVMTIAVLDELHQIFIPTRFCSFSDFLADMLGVIIMLMIIIFLYFIRRRNELQKD